jgi:hypothetical protein
MRAGSSLVSGDAVYCRASIVFNALEREVTVQPGEKQAKWDCGFENRGSRQVTIADIKTDCGCTVAKLDKKVVGPGETGVLKIIMDIARSTPVPKEEHRITVTTDDGQSHALRFIAHVVQEITIAPRMLLWRIGDDSPKRVTVNIALPALQKAFTGFHQSVGDAFEIRVEKGTEEGGYVVILKPRYTNGPLSAVLTPSFSSASPVPLKLEKFSIYAAIR